MSVKEMTAIELDDYLKSVSDEPILLDVRESWEVEKCSLEKSLHVPMRQIPSVLNELDPDRETIVICHHGIRSRAVAAYLDNNEFSKVINLSDGIDGWAKTVDVSMETY